MPPFGRHSESGVISNLLPVTPPKITLAEICRRAADRKIGKMQAKQELEHERLLLAIQMFDLNGDRKALTEILFTLAGRP